MSLVIKNLISKNLGCSMSRNIFNFTSTSRNKRLGTCNIVKPANISPESTVPDHIVKPDYYYEFTPPGCADGTSPPEIKDSQDIERMRETCKLASSILKSCHNVVKIGTTTDEIDRYVHQKIIDANAYPSPLRYGGFPKSICTSVNNVACHGIPDDRPLMDGDIVNVDITVFYKGYHGDCSTTFLVGDVDERGQFLVSTTKACSDEVSVSNSLIVKIQSIWHSTAITTDDSRSAQFEHTVLITDSGVDVLTE